ncbi:MAG: M15 family metallopeptidase [Acidimicrobiia bacterium]
MPKLLLIISLLASLAPGQQPEYTPAGNEAYTLDLELDGYVNGAMPSDRLLTLQGCTLERDAAYTYALLTEAARRDGVRLGWEDCYRSYNLQAASYNKRCPFTEVPTYTIDPLTGEKWQSGTKEVRECSGPPTARPGYSNHGWGRAVDFTNGRSVLGCRDKAYIWLQGNAYRFGWVHPDWAECGRPTQEPWHWEYAGVTDPTLVGYTNLNPDLLSQVR